MGKNQVSYYTLDFLFEGGRMFVASLSVMIVLSKVNDPGLIAALKMLQSVVFILFEVPSGILGDYWGNRKNLTISLCFGVCGLIIYSFASGLTGFVVGEIMLTLSLTFWSGSYEAVVINGLNIGASSSSIQSFFSKSTAINQVAILAAGILGGLVATSSYQYAYWIGSAILLIDLYVVQTISDSQEIPSFNIAINTLLVDVIRIMKRSCQYIALRSLGIFFVSYFFLQLTRQPLYHFWQPYFVKNYGNSQVLLTFVFASYSLTTTGILFLRTKVLRALQHSVVMVIYGTLFLVGYFCLSIPELERWVKIFAYSISFACMVGFEIELMAILHVKIADKQRASIGSAVSLVSRFGTFASMALALELINSRVLLSSYEFLFKLFAGIGLLSFIGVGSLSFLLNRNNALSNTAKETL